MSFGIQSSEFYVYIFFPIYPRLSFSFFLTYINDALLQTFIQLILKHPDETLFPFNLYDCKYDMMKFLICESDNC